MASRCYRNFPPLNCFKSERCLFYHQPWKAFHLWWCMVFQIAFQGPLKLPVISYSLVHSVNWKLPILIVLLSDGIRIGSFPSKNNEATLSTSQSYSNLLKLYPAPWGPNFSCCSILVSRLVQLKNRSWKVSCKVPFPSNFLPEEHLSTIVHVVTYFPPQGCPKGPDSYSDPYSKGACDLVSAPLSILPILLLDHILRRA